MTHDANKVSCFTDIRKMGSFLIRLDHNFISRIGSRMSDIFYDSLQKNAQVFVKDIPNFDDQKLELKGRALIFSQTFPRIIKHCPIPVESFIAIDREVSRIFVIIYRLLAMLGSLVTGKPENALKFLKLFGISLVRLLAFPFELLVQAVGRMVQLFHTETGLKIRRFAMKYFEKNPDLIEEKIAEKGICDTQKDSDEYPL